jgi:hypothetical protein
MWGIRMQQRGERGHENTKKEGWYEDKKGGTGVTGGMMTIKGEVRGIKIIKRGKDARDTKEGEGSMKIQKRGRRHEDIQKGVGGMKDKKR